MTSGPIGSLWTVDAAVAFATLSLMEIVLGVDNVVFIAILSAKLALEQQERARRIGLVLALVTRLALLFAISWMMGLTTPLFSLWRPFSGRDLILVAGGLFLIWKATTEIHGKLEGTGHGVSERGIRASLGMVIVQIMLLDIVFSLDSVITAVGMVSDVRIMIAAMIVAMLVMLFSMNAVSDFVERRPTVKILALSFLLLIGVTLVVDGTGHHLQKGYVYFGMGFSLFVELLNMRYRQRNAHVELHPPFQAKPPRRQKSAQGTGQTWAEPTGQKCVGISGPSW